MDTPRRRLDPDVLAEIRSRLDRLHAMAAAGDYNRLVAFEFQRRIGRAVPELLDPAREVREVVHDLEAGEPNVEPPDLHAALADFEAALDRLAAPGSPD